METDSSPRPGILGSFRALGDSLLAGAEDRLELLAVDAEGIGRQLIALTVRDRLARRL